MPARAPTAASSSSPTIATPWLDGKHTVFGAVVDMTDQAVVDAIRQGDVIQSVTIEGDASSLLASQAERISQWNAALGA